MESEIYKKQDEKCNIWLQQKLTPRKTPAIISMIEKMVETRVRKEVRELTENSHCILCKEQQETVQHLLAGSKMLVSSEYLARHNSMGKRTKYIRSECEMVSRKVEKGTCFTELLSKASMGL